MSNVDLSIGGRAFTVACADGEEQHVAGLGRLIDAKLAAMGDIAAQSESRMLLFAALLLADELHDLRLQTERAARQSGALDDTAARQLERIAERLENLAVRLENESAAA